MKKINYTNINDLDKIKNNAETHILRACTCNNVVRVLEKRSASVAYVDVIDMSYRTEEYLFERLKRYGFEVVKC